MDDPHPIRTQFIAWSVVSLIIVTLLAGFYTKSWILIGGAILAFIVMYAG